ncbi:XRE family transcriptional regulator [Salmonella enterica subsp. diarizonae]|uniref:XRE family transcriptional regulator n=1 Tax=Salmonella diarizonae TaxID=59204 RepID=A0A8F5N1L8_SALDZ|nr:XRE family transcriptional regulator [Salmonella enterica subsp. diarizonae]
MKDITNIAVTGEDGVVTYADGSKEEFACSGTVATIIASLATTLEKERTMRIATGDRLRRMYTRDSDMVSRGLSGAPSLSTAPTAMTADADPRLVALDVLRYAPAEAFSAVHPTPMSEIQLDQAIDVLEQVGDYMKANNVDPKVLTTGDAIRSINADNASFWGKKH